MVEREEFHKAFKEARTAAYKLLTGGKKPKSEGVLTTSFDDYLREMCRKHFKSKGYKKSVIKVWEKWFDHYVVETGALHAVKPKWIGKKSFIMTRKNTKLIGLDKDEFKKAREMIMITIYKHNDALPDNKDFRTVGSQAADGVAYANVMYGLESAAIEGMHLGHLAAVPEHKTPRGSEARTTVSELLEMVFAEKSDWAKDLEEANIKYKLPKTPHGRACRWALQLPDTNREIMALWLAKKNPKTLREANRLIKQAVKEHGQNPELFVEKAMKGLGWRGGKKEMYKTINKLKKLVYREETEEEKKEWKEVVEDLKREKKRKKRWFRR